MMKKRNFENVTGLLCGVAAMLSAAKMVHEIWICTRNNRSPLALHIVNATAWGALVVTWTIQGIRSLLCKAQPETADSPEEIGD